MPKISVIIATYNRAQYLPEAIDSVLNQSYQDFELVIVDDGSVDDTKAIVDKYINSNTGKIRYFYQENKGPGAARNRGIKEAKGEYVAFLDSDDIWLPEKLEKQSRYLEENPGYAMVYTDAYEFNRKVVTKKSKLATNDRGTMSGEILEHLGMGCFIFLSTVMVRKHVLEQIGSFNPNITIGEDWELWLKIAGKHKIGFIDEILVGYRKHAENIINNLELELQCRHRVINNIFNQDIREERLFNKRKSFHSKICFQGGYHYLVKGKHARARKELIQSICYNPLNLRSYKTLLQTLLPHSSLIRLKNIQAHLLSRS